MQQQIPNMTTLHAQEMISAYQYITSASFNIHYLIQDSRYGIQSLVV